MRMTGIYFSPCQSLETGGLWALWHLLGCQGPRLTFSFTIPNIWLPSHTQGGYPDSSHHIWLPDNSKREESLQKKLPLTSPLLGLHNLASLSSKKLGRQGPDLGLQVYSEMRDS